MIVFRVINHLYQKKRPAKLEKGYFLFVFCWIVFCFFTLVKGAGWPVPYLTCYHMTCPWLSFPGSRFLLSVPPMAPFFVLLDNGVPVKVILDVVCSEHASHLEVCWRQRVLLLLLAQLTVMTWTWKTVGVRFQYFWVVAANFIYLFIFKYVRRTVRIEKEVLYDHDKDISSCQKQLKSC